MQKINKEEDVTVTKQPQTSKVSNIKNTDNLNKPVDKNDLNISEHLFENENGILFCKISLHEINFVITHISGNKYGIRISKDNFTPNSIITGKIFENNAKVMKKNLSESIIKNLSLSELETKIIVDKLWEQFNGEFGELVFSTSNVKNLENDNFFRPIDKTVVNIDVLTDRVMKNNYFLTFVDSDETYYYRKGVYVQYGDKKIIRLVRLLLGDYAKISIIKEIIANIKSRTLIYRDSLDLNLNLINLKNGMFDIEKNILIPHGPQHQSIRQLAVNYDVNATCFEIEKFMDTTVEPEDKAPLYEAIAYCMIPKTNLKNSTLMLTGTGDNGKSKYLDIVKAFIGKLNTSSVSLHDLENDKFATHDLYGKLVNVFPDLKSDSIYDNSTFKILTGDDGAIRAQNKHQSAYEFDNVARMMFSANKLPPVPDDDMTAFFSRLMVFEFNKKFVGDNADKDIKEKITKPSELSGLFNILIESLKTILENNAFTYSKNKSELEKIYRMHSDDVMMFVDEKIVEDDEDKSIPKELMYKVYENWCKDNSITIKSKNKFTRRLTSLGFFIGKKGSAEKQIRSWMNCKFKSKEDNESQQEIQVNKPLIQVPLVKIE